jgi:hypothetical protein
MWLSLLTNKYVIIGAIVVAAGIYIMLLRANIATCEAEQNVLKAELAVSQASVKSLQAAINDQNTAIEKMKADSESREKAGKAAVEKAKVESLTFKRRAEDLMKVVPRPGITKCEAANELIDQEIKNAK